MPICNWYLSLTYATKNYRLLLSVHKNKHCFGNNSFSLKMRNCTYEVLIYWRDAPEKVQLHQVDGELHQRNLSNQRATSERETAEKV
jgi:hypothetical protein